MIYKEVSSNLEFIYHYMVRVFCLQVQCMCIKFSIYVVAPDYLKCYVIILHNTCYDNLILMGISFFLATRPYVIAWNSFILQNYISLSRITFMARIKIFSIFNLFLILRWNWQIFDCFWRIGIKSLYYSVWSTVNKLLFVFQKFSRRP